MPKLKAMTSYTAGRKITLNGTTYQPGAAIPAAIVKGLRNAGGLLSRRLIVPNVDPHGHRGKITRTSPIGVGSVVRKSL